MKKIKLVIFFIASGFFLNSHTHAELSRVQTLACETILCLSSSVQPSECNPALSYFYGIHHTKLSDTLSARRAFLNKCPDASAAGMQSLVNVIVDYSRDDCTIENLNDNLVPVYISYPSKSGPFSVTRSTAVVLIVDPELPESCRRYYNALIDHGYTAYDGLVYVGNIIGKRESKTDDHHRTTYYYTVSVDSEAEKDQLVESLSSNIWEWQ